MKNKYGHLASLVYETDKPVGLSFGDIEFYLDRLQDVSGPILEPGIGNGRFLIPLVNANKIMVGYDASPQMLALASAALSHRGLKADICLSDFENYQTDQCFDAVVIPAGSFQLIDSFDAASKVLTRFFGQLNEGGRLMIDIDPAHTIFNSDPLIRKWKTGTGAVVTLAASRLDIDYTSQIARELHRYELWENGLLQKTELEEFSLRWWGIDEITMAFRLAGFSHITVSGNYEFARAPHLRDRVFSIEGVKV